ncbi:hypothetical protein [Paenibacillus rigui]|nr:hypothetical protein [Paenibacillus rigui]
MSQRFIQAVRRYADLMLDKASDRFGTVSTPLFADGVDSLTFEPVRWQSQGETWVLSNLANQQNWLRTLDGLSELTGLSRYRERAEHTVSYALEELRYGQLLYWGGHMAFDLQTRQPVYASDKGPQHELKCHYPYYELMNRVNPERTKAYIGALWESHVTDWSRLEFSRHGQPAAGGGSPVWDRGYEESPVFFTGKGLTFINAGSDLYYAAAMLYRFSGDERPLRWAKRLAERYTDTRNPETGLGGYQFSISVLPGVRGDRAVEQFGEQLKEHAPIEATLSMPRQVHTVIGEAALCRMLLGEALGEAGALFRDRAVEDLLSYGQYSYDFTDHSIHPVLTNGTRLTGLVLEKSGYYGKRGERLNSAKADLLLLWSYTLGYRLTGDETLWSIARSMAQGIGLGDIGTESGEPSGLNLAFRCSKPVGIFAALELYRATGRSRFLQLAQRIGDQLLLHRHHRGLFMPSPHHRYAKLDALEPLALLHLAAELEGDRTRVPMYCGGKSFFAAAHDGYGHETDNTFIYGEVREK